MQERINLIILFVILVVIFFLYNFYVKSFDKPVTFSFEQMKALKMKSDKPILWIHLKKDMNARSWDNFSSRNSRKLNQGYIYLTIKSIIINCNKSFHICIIDDKTLTNLIQTPIVKSVNNERYRYVAKCYLLNEYGGLFVPDSFLCFKDLIDLMPKQSNQIVYSESFITDNNIFLGSLENNKNLLKIIKTVKSNIGFNTNSLYFEDKIKLTGNSIKIDSELIGLVDKHKKPIELANLFSTEFLQIQKNILGILIPQEEILLRTNYEWFARMSPNQVLKSNMILSKYILLATVERSFLSFQSFFEIK